MGLFNLQRRDFPDKGNDSLWILFFLLAFVNQSWQDCKSEFLGGNHTCALLNGETTRCWGEGSDGRLGSGAVVNIGDGAFEMGGYLGNVNFGAEDIAFVAAGNFHTCAVTATLTAKCWGLNSDGQLGYGDSNGRGDGASEMGDYLGDINLGTGLLAYQVSAGRKTSCALLNPDFTVKCWGFGNFGQLGIGNALTMGDNADEMGNYLPITDLGTGFYANRVSAGGRHTCALFSSDEIKCWGENSKGQVGDNGEGGNIGDVAGEMGNYLSPIDLGTGLNATSLAVGSHHSLVILTNGNMKAWGYNAFGQLGLEDTDNRGNVGPGDMGDTLPPINLGSGRTGLDMCGGARHSCAILDTLSVKC